MKRKTRSIQTKLLILIATFALAGCQSFRGVMYLKKPRVGDYLAKTANKGTSGDVQAWEKRRKLMEDIPDGNRVMGGFCASDAVVQGYLKRLRKLEEPCNMRMTKMANDANLQGTLFWSFLLASVGTGGLMITFAAIPADTSDTKNVLSIVAAAAGATTLVLALINGLGGFDGRQTVLNMRAKKVDNWMWSLRLRVINEVCNAKDRPSARQQAAQIFRSTRAICVTKREDDGTYEIPDRSRKN